MKRILVLLLILVGAFFAVKKWSPATLEKLAGVLKKGQREVAPADPQQWLPAPEPAPAEKPAAPAATPAPAERPAAVAVDKTAQVIVLCYHRVEGAAGGTLSITPELFEQHMKRLQDTGVSVISMQDFLAWRRNEKSIPKKSAIITVDDGYVSTFDGARPILQKFGYPWTCFIYTKFIGSGGKSITWEQLATMRDEGVEIGCHTASHISLRETRGKSPEAYEAWLREEIIGAKELIERKLAIKCAVFAYPEGKYSPKVLEIAKEAGYAAAFTVYGQRVTHGAPAEKIGRYAWYSRRPQDMEMALKFEGPLSSNDAEPPMSADLAAAMLLTQPMNGDVTAEPEPVLKANLSSLGKFDENSLAMRLSGAGPIPFKFDRENKIIEAKPPQPLKPGEHTVVVTAKAGTKKVETQWTFRFDPSGGLNAPLDSFSATPPAK
ncbi:MAG: polysaccharide deacetylase family protein [Chthoniobacteraceae bacterium]